MATLVSTGQITIVDNNDAKPITAYITASRGTQQVYTKDESIQSWTPHYPTLSNILTAKVYTILPGQVTATDVTSLLTNKKWSVDLGASIGAGNTYTISVNMAEATPSVTYYFEGDYTDSLLGLTSHIIAQITIGLVKTGTNAVYVLLRGNNVIEEATGTVKNYAAISADLMRASGVDTSDTTYRFFENNGATQIINSGNTATGETMISCYGLKTVAAPTLPSGSSGDINVNLPAAAAWSAHNTLVIHEKAISEMGIYRVEVKDGDAVVYQANFTIYDVSDPYDIKLIATADKFQNGVGNTDIWPLIWNGSTQVQDTTGWAFKWYFYDGIAPGNRAGFIDTTRTAVAGGRNITANTIGPASAITFDGAVITFAVGDMIKVVTSSGTPKYYEIGAASTNNIATIRTAVVSTFLTTPWPATSIAAGDFVGGKLFVCSGTGATAGTKTTAGAANPAAAITSSKINVTGDEIDGKGNIVCEASRP